MHWLFVAGISLDFAGAVLIAWTIYQRTGAETREEALTKWTANLWIVIFRLREQAFVRAGVGLLAAGFLLQWVAYVAQMRDRDIPLAAMLSVGIVVCALAIAHRFASDSVPVTYTDPNALPGGIRDERHAYNLASLEDVQWYRKNFVERIARTKITPRDVAVEPTINHGRWQFSCPDCGTAHIASATPLLNTAVCMTCGGEFPATYPAEQDEIERLLMARPAEENRNWEPGKTVASLQAENDAHGVVDGADA